MDYHQLKVFHRYIYHYNYSEKKEIVKGIKNIIDNVHEKEFHLVQVYYKK